MYHGTSSTVVRAILQVNSQWVGLYMDMDMDTGAAGWGHMVHRL